MKKKIRQMSIRQKLVFYSYLIISPILLLISMLLFLHNYKSAVQNEKDRSIQNVQSVSDSISVVQNNIMEMGTYISINNEIAQILRADETENVNRDGQLWLHEAPMQMIQDMMAIDGQIKTIAIYPENGINPYLRCMDRSSHISDMAQVREQEIYALAVQEKGKFLWQRAGQSNTDTYQYNQGDKIVMYREIYDLARRQKLGYLVIGSSAGIFDEICQNALNNEKEAMVVMSEYGAELVRCGNTEEFFPQLLSDNSIVSMGKELVKSSTWGNYSVYQCRNKEIGTVVYKIIPKPGILDFADTIMYTPLALLLGFMVGLYPVLILVSNIVSKPLHTLNIAMEKFKQGDFSQKIQVTTMDEVGEAVDCFNRMVDDIKELIDKNYVMALKERESELDVLQAQINPHFLYNTLDSLYWKAIEAGNEDIGEDIYSLSQLFRLVLNRGNGIVTVRTEAELLERYLHIQKMRFGKRLEYEILLEKEVLEEEIPKLILQPFVENAIVHGFERDEGEYLLTVSGKKKEAGMVFCIKDTGIGMKKEQIDAIWEKKENQENKMYDSQRIGGYAIRNVKERLELMYHADYELRIESNAGQGTMVILSIPCGMKEMHLHEH